jgi:hypothetical protein
VNQLKEEKAYHRRQRQRTTGMWFVIRELCSNACAVRLLICDAWFVTRDLWFVSCAVMRVRCAYLFAFFLL